MDWVGGKNIAVEAKNAMYYIYWCLWNKQSIKLLYICVWIEAHICQYSKLHTNLYVHL